MIAKKIIFIMLAATFALPAFSQALPYASIVEENSRYIGAHDKSDSNLTEDDFHRVLNRIENLYTNIITIKGGQFLLTRSWEDGTVNAYAQRTGYNSEIWEIAMFGGLARHPAVTEDAFALVACHEIGHHIGGLPKKVNWFWKTWAAAEGQSDYFGATKCLRRYFTEDKNIELMADRTVDPYVVLKCSEVYSEDLEQNAICQRTAMAGYSLAKLFEDLKELETPIEFTTPDQEIVEYTNVAGYPSVQCRLDTYLAAGLCNKTPDDDVNESDINAGLCTHDSVNAIGARPLCWFSPTDTSY